MAKVALETKKSMVKEITSRLNSAETLIVTSYKGLSAQDINELRKELKRIAGEYLVVKDSMAKIALKDGVNNRIAEFIQGEVGIVVYQKDISVVSKTLVKFLKDHELLKICGGFSNGEILSNNDIIAIASLPSREALLAKLANVLNSPIQGLAGSLSGIICKFLYALNAIKDKKEKQ
ncbi:MAG: 50S ribosomal protein L10 [Omnitrophica bacterium GWA2_41_15]|nr:MAG: 50S ribosomal protein L10 [Omnitrophica bacterium GWA2_41_15]HAZ10187.1 50S ribosomal protein L10 [Candidatus Omnitrophota bacterium]